MRFLAVLLFALLFSSPVDATRVYAITGQGGRMTSGGLVQLAGRIAKVPGLRVSIHSWKYPGQIIEDIRHVPLDEPIVFIGYSLGAHTTTYVAHYLHRKIALAVAYDPSIYSAVQFQAGDNIERFMLYHNNGRSRLGHARIHGPQVETTEINEGHLSVDWDQRLHQKTFEAVMKVLGMEHGRR